MTMTETITTDPVQDLYDTEQDLVDERTNAIWKARRAGVGWEDIGGAIGMTPDEAADVYAGAGQLTRDELDWWRLRLDADRRIQARTATRVHPVGWLAYDTEVSDPIRAGFKELLPYMTNDRMPVAEALSSTG
jgi:hypothetical protein